MGEQDMPTGPAAAAAPERPRRRLGVMGGTFDP
ncbi:nicotinate-nucleotide adenylyltransferase, partial [Streptomyces sp. NEAU-PBA10]